MIVSGIVIHENYGRMDWDMIQRNPATNLMLRAGYGAGNIDLQFRRNAQGCNDRKIPFGVCWQSYAFTPEMAKEEAQYCLETIEEYEIRLPVCIEYDYWSWQYGKAKGIALTCVDVQNIIEAFEQQIVAARYDSGVFIKS